MYLIFVAQKRETNSYIEIINSQVETVVFYIKRRNKLKSMGLTIFKLNIAVFYIPLEGYFKGIFA